jgi:WD40 repeat protein
MCATKAKTAAVVMLAVNLLAVAGTWDFRAFALTGPSPEGPQPFQASARERLTLKGHKGMVWAVAFSPDGKTLASVSGLYDKPGELILWDLATGKERTRIEEVKGIRSVAFSPDGKALATADYYDNTVKVRDPETGKARVILQQSRPNNAVAFSPDGKTLAIAILENRAELWQINSGRHLHTLQGHEDWVTHVAFSPDGAVLATGGRDQTVRLWEASTGKQRMTLRGHTGTIECVAFSPDGKTLATACWDKTIKLWEVATGKERLTLEGHKFQALHVAFSPDSRVLASTSGEADSPITDTNEKPGEIKLWDASTGKELASLTGHKRRVWSAVFSPDGKTLATSAEDETVKLWDLSTVRERGAKAPAAKEVEELWADLASADAPKAYQAVGKLASAPAQAVPLFKDCFPPEQAADPKRLKQIDQWITDLDSDDFDVREKATKELENVGAAAAPLLRKVLQGEPSPERKRRAELLLQQPQFPLRSPEAMRASRALEVLERIGTPEARQVLEALAQGTPEALLTREAKAALRRLDRKPVASH